MAEINSLVLTNNAVAHVLKGIHEPLIDSKEPSLSQYIVASEIAARVLDAVIDDRTIPRENSSDYQGTLVHWRQLV